MNNPANEKMPFTSHLEELRSRLIRIFAAIGILFIVCYFFKEKLFEVLTIPLVVSMPDNSAMIFTSLPSLHILLFFPSGLNSFSLSELN
jgi:sec-independent protein translocase protein TatC